MAIRFYIVPKTGTGVDPFDGYRPRYVSDLNVGWVGLDYGDEPTFLVGADVTTAQHTSLVANADVTAAPADLGVTVGGNLASVQAALEARNIPSHWVTADMPYKRVLWGIGCIMLLAQRADFRFFETGVTLNTTIAQLTTAQRTRLQNLADALGMDRSGVTGSTTMRQALRLLAQQMGEFQMNGHRLQNF